MIKRDLRFILLYSLILILLTSIPYFIGYQMKGEWVFTGFLFGVEDGNSYIAKMLRGANGAWLFRTPYTSIEQGGVVAFLPYTLLGKFAGGLEIHTQLVILYQLFRWLAILVYIYAVHTFLGVFIGDEYWKRIGVVVATIGGGLGWLILITGRTEVFGSIPLEFYSPETFGFLSILGLPHLLFSRAFLLLGLVSFLKAVEVDHHPALPGALILLAGIFQPLVMGIALVLLVVYGATLLIMKRMGLLEFEERKLLRVGLFTLLIPAPYIGYLLFFFTFDPFLSEWTAQNIILSPHPFHYVLAFLIVLIPAAYGCVIVLRERSQKGLILLIWFLLLPILAYAPYNLQRRLPDGVWIAAVALGMIGLSRLTIRESRVRWAGLLMIMLVIPSSILLLLGAARTATQQETPAFQPQDQVAAFQWIDRNIKSDVAVLASYETANPLPAWAYVRVPAGHGPESIKLKEILPAIHDFYNAQSDMTDTQRIDLITSLGIGVVFHGPNERALGDWEPSSAPYLSEVYREKDFAIFIVDENLRISDE